MPRLKLMLLVVLLALVGCPRLAPAPPSGPAAGVPAALAPGGIVQRPSTMIQGRVEAAPYKVQAGFGDMAANATIALIDPIDGRTLSTAITQPNGTFTTAFPGIETPDSNKVYILEAIKGGRVQDEFNQAGAPAVRPRTFLQWNPPAFAWKSLNSIASGDAVVISRSTTALAVGFGLRAAAASTQQKQDLRTAQSQGFIGKLKVGLVDATAQPPTPDTFEVNSQNPISNAEFHTLHDLVTKALNQGLGRVAQMAFDSGGKLLITGLDGAFQTWNGSTLTPFAQTRTNWAVARDVNGITYFAGPRDGQIQKLAADGTMRVIATIPGVSGLSVDGSSLYALVGSNGNVMNVDTTSGTTLTQVAPATPSRDVAILLNKAYIATRTGAILKASFSQSAAPIYQIPGGDYALRLVVRPNTGDLYFATHNGHQA